MLHLSPAAQVCNSINAKEHVCHTLSPCNTRKSPQRCGQVFLSDHAVNTMLNSALCTPYIQQLKSLDCLSTQSVSNLTYQTFCGCYNCGYMVYNDNMNCCLFGYLHELVCCLHELAINLSIAGKGSGMQISLSQQLCKDDVCHC